MMLINPFRFGVGCPTEALTFNTNAGITGTTEQSAICQLVTDLKNYNIWNDLIAVYPFVGGTATTHKYNLKNPLDTNAAFRLTFNGGWTHSSTGAAPNGVNGNCNTYVVGNTDIFLNDAGMGLYFRTNTTNTSAFGIGGTFHIHPRWTNNFTYWRICTISTGGAAVNLGTSLGLIHGYSNPTTISTGIYNGTMQTTFGGTQALASSSVVFGGGMPGYSFDTREIAFGFVSGGLTNTQASNLYTAIQTFQTTLGRQV